MEKKRIQFPLPPTPKRLQHVMSLLLGLSSVAEIKVTAQGISIERSVDHDEPVVPETILEIARGVVPEDPEMAALLSAVQLEALPADQARHPLTTLIEMTARIHKKGLLPSSWYVATGDGLDAFLGQPKDTLPAYLFGVPVQYVDPEQLPTGTLVLMGSSTRYTIDSAYGITADIGG